MNSQYFSLHIIVYNTLINDLYIKKQPFVMFTPRGDQIFTLRYKCVTNVQPTNVIIGRLAVASGCIQVQMTRKLAVIHVS